MIPMYSLKRMICASLTVALMLLVMSGNVYGGMYMSKTVKATLNGTKLVFDRDTGSLLSLNYPGPGTMLKAAPEKASLIDLAYPIAKFEPLRLASRFSTGATIDVQPDQVVVHWDKLGASRTNFDLTGAVAATVTLRAATDGASIIMKCEVTNSSDLKVRQVLFPDLTGLQPFAGVTDTEFRTAGFLRRPFLELPPDDPRLSMQFCQDPAAGTIEFKSGGAFSDMWLRWMDFGGLSGGLSLFHKAWGWTPNVPVRLHYDPDGPSLRLLCNNLVAIEPGAKWDSGEFILTPHTNGWAKGIEPYRQYALSKIHREYPVPKHVREGLGYRSIWMCNGYVEDPKDAVWKISDLLPLAKECKEHGLDEMVLWGWCAGFELPLPGPMPHLGTEADLVKAVADCKQIGVNVAPFISVVQVGHKTGAKYGVNVPTEGGWAQHSESIPQFQAPYVTYLQSAGVPINNPLWLKEVGESCSRLVEIGIPSLSWDQFWTTPTEDIINALKPVRALAKQKDPESTLSGEELWNLEIDADYLDYTWNWGSFRDFQAYTSVFPAPRFDIVITASAIDVKRAFMDSIYLNIFPRTLGNLNGSDWISKHKELSVSLKQCAKLRKQFLPYFTEGKLIGNCLLSAPAPGTHVSSYVLPDRAILMLLNLGGKRQAAFSCDLAPWVESSSGKYTVKAYDLSGDLKKTTKLNGSDWKNTIRSFEPGDVAIYEFEAE